MRLHFLFIVFASSLLVATLLILYQALTLSNNIQQSGFDKYKKINLIESRVHQLEEDIFWYKETTGKVKKLVQRLRHSDETKKIIEDELREILQSNDDRYLSHNASKPFVNQEDCKFGHTSSSPVDLQMKNIYDSVKFDNPYGGVWTQGWDLHYNKAEWSSENILKVFVTPHSHNDPGWKYTFIQYYEYLTKFILDNMVKKLGSDSRRKFIWAEICFFSLWWNRQSSNTKEFVKRLVQQGQLEFVTGGWVMPDEANSHYYSMLDQLLTGHEWLQNNVGVKPKNGWAIDPFGLSPTMAYILKRSGLENMVIQRGHYAIKKHLAMEKSLEFRWRQIWDPEETTDILCQLMPFFSYSISYTCGPDPYVCYQFDFMGSKKSFLSFLWQKEPEPITDTNVAEKSRLLLEQYRKKSQLFRSNVLLIPLGDDFRYSSYVEWDKQYGNYEKLFDYMNSRRDWNVQAEFGTLSDYFNALRKESFEKTGHEDNLFPSLSGDFFSYSDKDEQYWTGYYTSRPFYKRMDRILMGYMRASELLLSLMLESRSNSALFDSYGNIHLLATLNHDLIEARQNMNLFQHHDGITGTAKNYVVVDYAIRMLHSIKTCQNIIQQAAHALLSKKQDKVQLDPFAVFFNNGQIFMDYNSTSSKHVIQMKESALSIYFFNPDAHIREELQTVRVNHPYVKVFNRNGKIISCQVDPVLSIFGQIVEHEFDVSFIITLNSLSITAYDIQKLNRDDVDPRLTLFAELTVKNIIPAQIHEAFLPFRQLQPIDDIHLDTTGLSCNFTSDGTLSHLITEGAAVKIGLQFVTYYSKGGAYLFIPSGDATPIPINGSPVWIIKGLLRSSVIVSVQRIRLLHQVVVKNLPGVDGKSLEMNNYVDISQQHNYELAMRFNSNIKNLDVFYTDLNGFQVIRRQHYPKLPLQANFYPMPSLLYIQDTKYRLSLHSGGPLGCASLNEGQMEVMLDRQLIQDDQKGLGHGVTDNVLTLNTFRILLERKMEERSSSFASLHGLPSLTSHSITQILNSPTMQLYPTVQDHFLSSHWSLGGDLPCDIELVSLRPIQQPKVGHKPLHSAQDRIPSAVGLTLHRKGFSCLIHSKGMTCNTSNGSVQLSDLLSSSFKHNIKRMSLSHLHEGNNITKSDSLTLKPMELYAFRLYI